MKFKNSSFYLWYIRAKKNGKSIRNAVERAYSLKNREAASGPQKCVICMHDKNGGYGGGGLADRLKGMLCTYSVCRKYGLPFRIHFIDPFPLLDYFIPAGYDWRIEPGQISYDVKSIRIVALDNTSDSPFMHRKQKAYLERKLRRIKIQTHVFTNAAFVSGKEYGILFNELFRPSERLAKSIAEQKGIIGQKYISISCRFLNMFGDFNETCCRKKIFTESGKQRVLAEIDGKVGELLKDNPGCRLLVNSDSTTFLQYWRGKPCAYVIPGTVTHIDNIQDGYNYEKYEKTFLDFMMIASAEKIFVLANNYMHISGYPRSASFIYGRPFETVRLSCYPEDELVDDMTAGLASPEGFKVFLTKNPNILKTVLNASMPGITAAVIWGTGVWGRVVKDVLALYNIQIPFFIDSDLKKSGTDCCGIPVRSPDCLKGYSGTVFIAVKRQDADIAETAKKLGGTDLNVIRLRDFLKSVTAILVEKGGPND